MNSEQSSYLLIDAINGNTSVIYSRKLKLFYTESATVGSGHTTLYQRAFLSLIGRQSSNFLLFSGIFLWFV